MEYSFYDFLKLLGSLALFLYGMKIMSEGLQKFAGDRLRSILTAMTTNRVTGYRYYSHCMDYICFGFQGRYISLFTSSASFRYSFAVFSEKFT